MALPLPSHLVMGDGGTEPLRENEKNTDENAFSTVDLGTPGAHIAASVHVPVGDGRLPPKTLLIANMDGKPKTEQAVASSKPVEKRRRLDHIGGIRAMATVWIVLGHFAGFSDPGTDVMPNALHRGMVPVTFYVMLSGFITHYAYAKNDFFSQKGAKRAYMLKRFMRCAPAYYLAILGGWGIWLKYQTGLFTGEDKEGGFVDRVNEYGVVKNMLVPELFWAQAWLAYLKPIFDGNYEASVDNLPAWTMSTLLFSWFVFPWLKAAAVRLPRWGVGPALVSSYIVAMLPALAYMASDQTKNDTLVFNGIYYFPPFRVAEFFMGMLLAEMLRRKMFTSWKGWGVLADIATAIVMWAVASKSLFSTVNDMDYSRRNFEAYYISGFSPLIGIVLFGTSTDHGLTHNLIIGKLADTSALKGLGFYTFQVYLFQDPLHRLFSNAFGFGLGDWSGDVLCVYVMALWLLAGIFTNYVETPFYSYAVKLIQKYVSPPKPKATAAPLTTTPPPPPPVSPSSPIKKSPKGGVLHQRLLANDAQSSNAALLSQPSLPEATTAGEGDVRETAAWCVSSMLLFLAQLGTLALLSQAQTKLDCVIPSNDNYVTAQCGGDATYVSAISGGYWGGAAYSGPSACCGTVQGKATCQAAYHSFYYYDDGSGTYVKGMDSDSGTFRMCSVEKQCAPPGAKCGSSTSSWTGPTCCEGNHECTADSSSTTGLMICAAPPTAAPSSEPTTVVDESTQISPNDPYVGYLGRFDFSDDSAVKMDWSASTIAATFTGSYLAVELEDASSVAELYNEFEVEIDGEATQTLSLSTGGTGANANVHVLARGLSSEGSHTVKLVKRTEADPALTGGPVTFRGFYLEQGHSLLPRSSGSRRIEVVGESIEAGYGCEGADASCGYTPATESAYAAWGSVLGRSLNADVSMAVWSGLGLMHNFDDVDVYSEFPLPFYYDRSLASEDTTWDFSRYSVDAVIVNLGTNDFQFNWDDQTTQHPTSAQFITAYRSFVKDQVRANYGADAQVFLIGGPSEIQVDHYCSSDCETNLDAIQEAVKQMNEEDGDDKVTYVDMVLDTSSMLGCNYHPNSEAHAQLAALVEAVVGPAMGWDSTSGTDDDDGGAQEGGARLHGALVASVAAAAALVLAFGSYKVHSHTQARRQAEAAAEGQYASLPAGDPRV